MIHAQNKSFNFNSYFMFLFNLHSANAWEKYKDKKNYEKNIKIILAQISEKIIQRCSCFYIIRAFKIVFIFFTTKCRVNRNDCCFLLFSSIFSPNWALLHEKKSSNYVTVNVLLIWRLLSVESVLYNEIFLVFNLI